MGHDLDEEECKATRKMMENKPWLRGGIYTSILDEMYRRKASGHKFSKKEIADMIVKLSEERDER